ncbi:MAG TPA: DUF58 domain-containing protein [Pirellulaceae bacterium]|nr:DUF58 domain-containing protein [Pirellulaceae bacterium]HMO91967.1 DUF58 domain-containing protein [Pirellulaceae bacterium]HMP68766.1 DUF58 domain-containing protein [Pirellulaceae bacterium]
MEEIIFADVVVRDGLKRKYFSPRDMRRLSHAVFSSRRAIQGLFAGKFRTRQSGQSIEFHDYREYLPGDQINHIDWKVYARTDRLFIKLFEHQTDLAVHLLVDRSRSMLFNGLMANGDSKYDFACRMAAAICFLVSKQNDRFSFSTASGGLVQHVSAGNSMQHLVHTLDEMERVRPAGDADLAAAVEQLMETSRKKDLLCLFSDLLDEDLYQPDVDVGRKRQPNRRIEHPHTAVNSVPRSLIQVCKKWLQGGGEVVLFHIMHPDDIKLPDVDDATFYDLESNERVRVNISAVRERFAKRVEEFLAGWAGGMRKIGVDYNLVRVSADFLPNLERFFSRRRDRLTSLRGRFA